MVSSGYNEIASDQSGQILLAHHLETVFIARLTSIHPGSMADTGFRIDIFVNSNLGRIGSIKCAETCRIDYLGPKWSRNTAITRIPTQQEKLASLAG